MKTPITKPIVLDHAKVRIARHLATLPTESTPEGVDKAEPHRLDAALAISQLASTRDVDAVQRALEHTSGESASSFANKTTIGVWDLSPVRTLKLGRILRALSASQELVAFFEVKAWTPTGLVSTPERVFALYRSRKGRAMPRKLHPSVQPTVFADDFFDSAAVVREDCGLDYLVGVTPYNVGDRRGGDFDWDLFTASQRRCLLASSSLLPNFARHTDISVEAFVAWLIVAQVLVEVNPRTEFHSADRDCLFDENADYDSLQRSIAKARIEDSCLKTMKPKFRDPAVAMVRAINAYIRRSHSAHKRRKTKRASRQDKNRMAPASPKGSAATS
jgi:hypothetical protein